MVLKTNIIRIGNSKGVRIPKLALEACNLKGRVHLEVRGDCLVIRPPRKARAGWAEAFRRGAAMKVKEDLPGGCSLPATEWDRTEWDW